MKIVILSDGFPPEASGGAEVIVRNLAHLLSKKGNEVSVVTTVRNKEKVGIVKDGEVTVYRLYSDYHDRWRAYKCIYDRRIVKEVKAILKDLNPDVVHAHNVHAHLSYASLKIAKQYSKAVFLTFHDVMSVHYGKLGASVNSAGGIMIDKINPLNQILLYRLRYNPFRNILIKYYLSFVDKKFSVSNALKEVLEKNGIRNIEVLQNGINPRWADLTNQNVFKEKYCLNNKKVIFFGGRLSSAKGGLVSIDVLNKVGETIKDVVLLIAGSENKASEEMLRRAEQLGVKDKIIFTGWIPNNEMPSVYKASDVVLVLSQYIDPFPTVNLEAMASSKPVIGTMFGGTPEAVLDSQTGFVVNPRDVEQISERVTQLLMDSSLASRFGAEGIKRVSRDFNEEDWVEKTLLCYSIYLNK